MIDLECKKKEGFLWGKVLIAAFDDKDEIAFDELLLFLKSNSHIKVVNAFPNDSCLKYDNHDNRFKIQDG